MTSHSINFSNFQHYFLELEFREDEFEVWSYSRFHNNTIPGAEFESG